MRFFSLWNEVPLEILRGEVWELSCLFHEYLVKNIILWSVKSNWLYIVSLKNKNYVDAKSQQHLSSLVSWRLITSLSTVYLSFFCARMKQVSTIFVLLTISLSILYYFFSFNPRVRDKIAPFLFCYSLSGPVKKKSFKPDRGRIRTRGGMLEIPGRIV